MNKLSLSILEKDNFKTDRSNKLQLASSKNYQLYEHVIKFSVCYISSTSSVIRQKGESQNGGNKKTKHPKFSRKANNSYPDTHSYDFRNQMITYQCN